MNKKRTLVIAAILLVVAVGIGLIVFNRSGTSPGQTTVRVPINVPLTGPIAAWSGQFPNGFKMGIEEACKEHGIDPAVFVVDAQDNAAQPSQAVSIFRKQELAGFNAYISVTTGAANAISPLLDGTGVPHFIAAFDPFIVKDAPSRFRVMANSKIEAPLFIQYAKDKSAKSVFIIQLDFSYAEDEFSKMVEPALKAAGITTAKERFALDQRDFKIIVEKAKVNNPDVVFLCGYSFHLQPLIRDLRAVGLATPGRIMTTMDLVDLLYADNPRSEFQGVVFACPSFDIPSKVSIAQAWRERYTKRFGSKPTYVPAYAYDNATLIVRAYSQQRKTTPESIRAAVPFDGVNGRIDLDKDGDILSTLTVAKLNEDGQIIELSQ